MYYSFLLPLNNLLERGRLPASGQGSLPPGLQLLVRQARTSRLSKLYTRGKFFFMLFLLSLPKAVTWYGQLLLVLIIALPNILIRINERPLNGHFYLWRYLSLENIYPLLIQSFIKESYSCSSFPSRK